VAIAAPIPAATAGALDFLDLESLIKSSEVLELELFGGVVSCAFSLLGFPSGAFPCSLGVEFSAFELELITTVFSFLSEDPEFEI
jgi:hypothetical protein